MSLENGKKYLATYLGRDENGVKIYAVDCSGAITSGDKRSPIYLGRDEDGVKVYATRDHNTSITTGGKFDALYIGRDENGVKVYATYTCLGCDIFLDDFNRSNTSDLDGATGTDQDWVETNWSIVSNKASTTSANHNAITVAVASSPSVQVFLDFQTTAANAVIKLIVNWQDDNNYLYAEFMPVSSGCGYIKFYEREGGVNTQIGTTLEFETFLTSTTYKLHFCLRGDHGEAYFIDDTTSPTRTIYHEVEDLDGTDTDDGFDGIYPGRHAGFGVGANAGTVTVDNWEWRHHASDCEPCDADVPCTEFYDSFNRSNSTDVGCNWEEMVGDWEIDTNKLQIASSYASIKVVSSSPGPYEITAKLSALTVNVESAAYRLLGDYVDNDNYWFAEVYYDGVTLYRGNPLILFSLGQRSAGVDIYHEQLNGVLGAAEITLSSPDADGVITASYSGGSGFTRLGREAGADWVPTWGLGTGDSSVQGDFDYAYKWRMDSTTACNVDVSSCGTYICEFGDLPQYVQVDIQISGANGLGDVSPAAGTYLMDRRINTFVPHAGPGFPIEMFTYQGPAGYVGGTTAGGGCGHIVFGDNAPLQSIDVVFFYGISGANMPTTVCALNTPGWFAQVWVRLQEPFGGSSYAAFYGYLSTNDEDTPPDCTSYSGVRCYLTINRNWGGGVTCPHVDIDSVDPV